MPIQKLNSNLYKIKELTVDLDKSGYFISMNPGKAAACVLCISRKRPVTIDDLKLTEQNLKDLSGGRTMEIDGLCTLQGITRNLLTSVSQYRNFKLNPPAYIQVWGMSMNEGVILHIPESVEEQTVLVPVFYQVSDNGNSLQITMGQTDGYVDGDLLYQFDNHLPIPVPGSALNKPFPLRRTGDVLRVVPTEGLETRYIEKK